MTAFRAGGPIDASWSPLKPPQDLPKTPTRPLLQGWRDNQSALENKNILCPKTYGIDKIVKKIQRKKTTQTSNLNFLL